MSDYKRLVSYIYSYPGGVRDKNVGFIKAEVRNGQLKLSISLKGVYTDVPETFGVYLMVDKDEDVEGRYTLIKIGSMVVNNGTGQYTDLLNPQNINQSKYTFADIAGIAIADPDNQYYMMFSLWQDSDVNPAAVNFAPEGYQKGQQPVKRPEPQEENPDNVMESADRINPGIGPVIDPAALKEAQEIEEREREMNRDRDMDRDMNRDMDRDMNRDMDRDMNRDMDRDMDRDMNRMPIQNDTQESDQSDEMSTQEVKTEKKVPDYVNEDEDDSDLMDALVDGDSELIGYASKNFSNSLKPDNTDNAEDKEYNELFDDSERVFEKTDMVKAAGADNTNNSSKEYNQNNNRRMMGNRVQMNQANQRGMNSQNYQCGQRIQRNYQQNQQMQWNQQMQQNQQVQQNQQMKNSQQMNGNRRNMNQPQPWMQRQINRQIQATENEPVQNREKIRKEPVNGFEAAFMNADFIDAFDDDYFYDCVEVSPDQLKAFPVEDESIINNSFLIHGYYNYKHILFGRVRENDNNTKYFLGVPGMYCNRERFMASMFGFNNFKKSHRSDYTNPYFGYWYQEL